MAYCIDSRPAAGLPGEVHTTQLNDLLTVREFSSGTYIYLKGVASVIAGSWVAYDELGVTTGLDSDVAASIVSSVAVSTAAVDATTKYGWFGVKGAFSAGAGTVADNAKVYATSTVFICDDAAVTGNQVHGAVWRSADSSNLATVQIDFPFIGVTDAII
jgi:hypothetical protein